MTHLLSDRFKNDGKPAIFLTATQRSAIRDFLKNEDCALESKRCVVCDGSAFDVISEKDRFGMPYPTGLCRSCGNIQQTAYYSDQTLGKLYSQYYRRILAPVSPDRLFTAQYLSKGPRVFDFSRDWVPQTGCVLEIGCGSGGILKYFSDRGFHVEGIDLDDEYMDAGRRSGLKLVRTSVDEFEPDHRFDLIIMSHVIEHLTDPRSVLTKVRLLLKDQGRLYVEVPSIHITGANFQYDFLRYLQNPHFIHFSNGSMRNILRRVGLNPIANNDFIQAVCSVCEPVTEITNVADAVRTELAAAEDHYLKNRNRIRITHAIQSLGNRVLARLGLNQVAKRALRSLGLRR